MADYETTMKDLMSAVKYMLEQEKTSSGNLSQVRQIKKGVLPLRPVYPCIAITPSYEMIIAYRSSRKIIVEREVVAHILTMDASGKNGLSYAQQIAEKCLDTLKADIHATDGDGNTNAISVVFDDLRFNEGKKVRGAGIYNVSLTCTYKSKGSLSATTHNYNGTQVDNTRSDVMADTIRDHLASKHATTLKGVKKFEVEQWGANASFPRILVSVMSESQRQEKRGIDMVYGSYKILIESLIGTARDSSMDFNLNLLEYVKNALSEKVYWNGKCFQSSIGLIEFAATKANGKPIYQTSVTYQTIAQDVRTH